MAERRDSQAQGSRDSRARCSSAAPDRLSARCTPRAARVRAVLGSPDHAVAAHQRREEAGVREAVTVRAAGVPPASLKFAYVWATSDLICDLTASAAVNGCGGGCGISPSAVAGAELNTNATRDAVSASSRTRLPAEHLIVLTRVSMFITGPSLPLSRESQTTVRHGTDWVC